MYNERKILYTALGPIGLVQYTKFFVHCTFRSCVYLQTKHSQQSLTLKYRLISPNIAQYCLLSPNIAYYYLTSPNTAYVTWEWTRLFNHLIMVYDSILMARNVRQSLYYSFILRRFLNRL